MKFISIGFALFLTATQAFAGQISDKDMPAYKEAMVLAINAQALTCHLEAGSQQLYGYSTVIDLINASTSITVTDGEQPLLNFMIMNGDNMISNTVTTSADYKTIVSVRVMASQLTSTESNTGTLAKPNIVTTKAWKTYANYNCTPKDASK